MVKHEICFQIAGMSWREVRDDVGSLDPGCSRSVPVHLATCLAEAAQLRLDASCRNWRLLFVHQLAYAFLQVVVVSFTRRGLTPGGSIALDRYGWPSSIL